MACNLSEDVFTGLPSTLSGAISTSWGNEFFVAVEVLYLSTSDQRQSVIVDVFE